MKIVAFHPRSTDTPLSKPFLNSSTISQLFSPDFVAQQLFAVMDHLVADGRASFVEWVGEPILWS
ncbi:Rossmann-fold NAD(P)-binding domain-containing protein [Celerinatantimonas yamalensis]|uniref:Uncharacterized protein n=1 Tax=Celerinatantimonas yamalensis TaxID=559956 RepID=A0ABW9G7F8_9GAMM